LHFNQYHYLERKIGFLYLSLECNQIYKSKLTVKIMAFDFRRYCIPCANWCCKGEAVFFSDAEKQKIDLCLRKKENECDFLEDSGSCSIYSKRPFECRIFPYDVLSLDGELNWVLWNVCPASAELDAQSEIDRLEREISRVYSLEYVKSYVKYHQNHQPKKYAALTFRPIKAINWERTKSELSLKRAH